MGGDDAEIVLDCKGRILSFSASAVVLLGRTVTCAEQVQTIGRLIPVLPLREATAGYNMAYVLFWFGQGQWRECDAVDCEGRSVPVTVTVRRIDGGDEGSYRVLMRQRRALDALNVH